MFAYPQSQPFARTPQRFGSMQAPQPFQYQPFQQQRPSQYQQYQTQPQPYYGNGYGSPVRGFYPPPQQISQSVRQIPKFEPARQSEFKPAPQARISNPPQQIQRVKPAPQSAVQPVPQQVSKTKPADPEQQQKMVQLIKENQDLKNQIAKCEEEIGDSQKNVERLKELIEYMQNKDQNSHQEGDQDHDGQFNDEEDDGQNDN